jgi:HEPN domain-containing protein
MTYDNEIEHWLKAAVHDLDAVRALFEKGKYDWYLFIAHLVLEKTLKAFYVRDNHQMPPPIHKLDILASKIKLKLSKDGIKFLKEVNEFNIEARYPDKKFFFYKLLQGNFRQNILRKLRSFINGY